MKSLAAIFVLVAWTNFLLWCPLMAYFQGTAIGGKIENGRYYLHKRHGFTEVSQTVFEWLRVHDYVTLAMFATSIVLALVLRYWEKREKSKSPQPPDTL